MKKHNITLKQLIQEYEKRNSPYFDKKTLKFWGGKIIRHENSERYSN